MRAESQEHRRYREAQERDTRQTYTTRNPFMAALRYLQVNLGITPEARNAIRRATRGRERRA